MSPCCCGQAWVCQFPEIAGPKTPTARARCQLRHLRVNAQGLTLPSLHKGSSWGVGKKCRLMSGLEGRQGGGSHVSSVMLPLSNPSSEASAHFSFHLQESVSVHTSSLVSIGLCGGRGAGGAFPAEISGNVSQGLTRVILFLRRSCFKCACIHLLKMPQQSPTD